MQEEKDAKGLNSRSVEGVGSRGIFRRKTPSLLPSFGKPGVKSLEAAAPGARSPALGWG